MIEVKNLSKSFDGKKNVLDHISFSLKKGEICGLIGANGAGKTTLLRCMAGVISPSEGAVEIDSVNVFDHSEVHNEIAYMSDSARPPFICRGSSMVRKTNNLYDHFSKEKFYELNKRFHVRTGDFMTNYSKGQMHKFNIMLTFAKNGQMILMDEPEDGLDAESRHLFRTMLEEELEKGENAILFSSHDMETVEKICDRIIMIKQGRIVLDISVDNIMNRFQKWTVLTERPDEVAGLPDVYVGKVLGHMYGYYSFGDSEMNEKRIRLVSGGEVTREKIHLKDIMLLMERENIQPELMANETV